MYGLNVLTTKIFIEYIDLLDFPWVQLHKLLPIRMKGAQ